MKKILLNIVLLAVGFTAAAQTEWKAQVDSLVENAPEYNEFNQRRRSLLKVLPVKSSSIVFLGDSITNGGEWAELFENPEVLNRGISGDRVVWLFDRIDYLAAAKPKKIFLLIGINDLLGGRTKSHDVVIMIAELLTRLHSMTPDTELYLQSILPVNLNGPTMSKYKSSTILQRIDNCNTWLGKWCAKNGFVTYIDIASSMKDAEGMLNENLTFDGLHPNGTGYLIWKDVIEGYVNE